MTYKTKGRFYSLNRLLAITTNLSICIGFFIYFSTFSLAAFTTSSFFDEEVNMTTFAFELI